ncbi:MAG: lipopolysaccharide biosynthesis protein [Bacteroidaceae bacterium]|nr:lipopolysaccharide biosynthesis protein [Bacteroidaceae bacterium]
MSSPGGNLKSAVAKGFLWGGMSNALCQLLNLFLGIYLARILGPDDYGPVGMLAIFSAIAGSLQDSGFVAALANRKEVTHKDYNAVFWFNVLISVAMYVILFASAPLLVDFFNEPSLLWLSRYIFIGFVVAGFGIAPSAYLFRELKVKERSVATILSIIVSGTVGIALAMNGYSYWGIATQSILYVLVRSAVYWWFTPWRPSFRVTFAPLRYLFAFSYRLLVTNIFLRVNWNIFSVILGGNRSYSATDVGNYTKAAEWMSMGSEVVNGMVNGIAQPVFARVADDDGRQLHIFRKMLRFTAFVSFPLLLGLSLVAPEIIVIAITDKWLESAYMLRILAVWGAFMPIQSMFTNLLISRGRSVVFMWGTIVQGLLVLMLLVGLAPLGINTMLAAYVIFNVLWLFVWRYYAGKEVSLTLTMFLRDLLPFASLSAVVMFSAYWLTVSIDNIYMLLFARIAIAALLYILLLALFRCKELYEAARFLLHKNENQRL